MENPDPLGFRSSDFSPSTLRPTIDDTRILKNVPEIGRECMQLIDSSKEEVLVALISERSPLRNTEFFNYLSRKIEHENKKRGKDNSKCKFRIRAIFPNEDVEKNDEASLREAMGAIEYRTIESVPIGFGVFDRKVGFLVQYDEKAAAASDVPIDDAIASAVLTTNPQTVSGLVTVFDALWRQSELLEQLQVLKEQKKELEATALDPASLEELRDLAQVLVLKSEFLITKIEKSKDKDQDLLPIALDFRISLDQVLEILMRLKKYKKK